MNAVSENAFDVSGGKETVRVEIDPATGLPARTQYQSVGMQGAPQQVTATYSDWRDISGIRVPFKVTIEQGGQKFAEGVVTDVKLNTGLSASEVGQKP